MKPHRIISHSCALAAAALVLLPAGAQAGSALSGYGGPGQGSQAVLGAALIGGHRGGSQGGSGGSSGGSASGGASEAAAGSAGASETGSGEAAGSSQQGSSSGSPSNGGARHGSSHSGNAGEGSSRQGSSRSASGSAAQAPATARGFYPASERVPAGGEGTVFGLTGGDLLLVILAAGILVLLGGLTWRMGDSSHRARADG